MNRTGILEKVYQVCTWWIQRVTMAFGQAVTSTRALSSSSTRATLDSSSAPMPLVAVLILLRDGDHAATDTESGPPDLTARHRSSGTEV